MDSFLTGTRFSGGQLGTRDDDDLHHQWVLKRALMAK